MFGRRKRLLERILVVEDEPLVAFDNEYFLSEESYVVVGTVDCVAEAVAIIASGTPIDLVLTDIALADGNGVDVARAARDVGIHVLFVTGDCPTEARPHAHGWLAKPYRQRDLALAIRAIDELISGSEPSRLPDGLTLFVQA